MSFHVQISQWLASKILAMFDATTVIFLTMKDGSLEIDSLAFRHLPMLHLSHPLYLYIYIIFMMEINLITIMIMIVRDSAA